MKPKQGSEMREFDRLFRKIEQRYHNISLKMGLSDTAGQILYAMIELGDGCLQTEIARWYSYSKQTISSAVKVMERKGLLRTVKAEYAKAAAELDALKAEIIKALRGESTFTKELLGSMVAESETK